MAPKRFKRKEEEHWLNEKWRPMMGWMYMAICMFDFMVAPILWSLLQAKNNGMVASQWQPLTLQGAGLFHLAMGAVLGISAYGRTQEKMNAFPSSAGTSYIPPQMTSYNQQNSGFNQQQPQQGFNNFPQSNFNQPQQQPFQQPMQMQQPMPVQPPITTAPVVAGFAGKKAPNPPADPVL